MDDGYKDKYIQVLQDKIALQEKVNMLFSEVIDLKAQLLNPATLASAPKDKGPNSRSKGARVVVLDSSADDSSESTKSSVDDSSGSEVPENPREMVPLKHVIDSRHSGTIGMLTNREKMQLKNATRHFLNKYGLRNSPDFIPRGFIDKYNNYLDRKIEEGLFSSPKRKKKRDGMGSPMKSKVETQKKVQEIVDPAVAKLFENEIKETDTQSTSFRDKVIQKYQQKKMYSKESEPDSGSDTSQSLSRMKSTDIVDSMIVGESEADELESGEYSNEEMDLINQESQKIVEDPILIDNGLDDIDKLMESSGYELPSKNIPIRFNENTKMGDFESRIFNRVSGSVLDSSESTKGWVPWDLLLQQHLDKEIGVEKRFITFTMNFCAENGISPRSVTVGNHSSMGIPPHLVDKYVKEFKARVFPSVVSDYQEEILDQGHGKSMISFDDASPRRTLPTKIASIIPSFDEVTTPQSRSTNFNTLSSGIPSDTSGNHNMSQILKTEPPLTRYNTLLTTLIPEYNTLDKDKRLLMKKKVLSWLRTKLGTENVKLCKLKASAHGTVFTTFGIPKFVEASFLDWAREELNQLFN